MNPEQVTKWLQYGYETNWLLSINALCQHVLIERGGKLTHTKKDSLWLIGIKFIIIVSQSLFMDVTHSTLYVSKKPQTGLLRLLLCVPAFWANSYKRSYWSSSLTNRIETFSVPLKLCSYATICIFTDHSEGLYNNQTKCVKLLNQKNVNWTN